MKSQERFKSPSSTWDHPAEAPALNCAIIPLRIAFSSLSGMWELIKKAGELQEKCSSLDSQLSEVVPHCRSVVFQSITSVSITQSYILQCDN